MNEMDVLLVDDFLAHHGVKGMKWGIRNEYEPIGRKRGKAAANISNTRSKKNREKQGMSTGKKVAIGLGIAAAIIGGTAIYLNRDKIFKKAVKVGTTVAQRVIEKTGNITADTFFQKFVQSDSFRNSGDWVDKMLAADEGDIRLPSGTVFKRISGDVENKIRENVYASFTKDDVNRYKAILPNYFSWINKNNAYEISMKAKTEIIAPSAKVRFDTFVDLLQQNPKLKEYYKIDSPEKALQIGKKTYYQFALHDAGKTQYGKEYFNMLKSMGYNAWIDDNDKGKLSDMPMVLINAPSIVERLEAVKIKDIDYKEAFAALNDLKVRY